MLSVGIDPALNHLGVALLKNGSLIGSMTHVPKARGIERLYEIKCFMTALIDRVEERREPSEPAWWGLEDYAWAARERAHQMGEVGGQIRLSLYERKITPWILNQSEIKKFITSKGNAPKDRVLLRVGAKWPELDLKSADEAEALVIADMLHQLYLLTRGGKEAKELTNYQVAVLEKHLRRAKRGAGSGPKIGSHPE